MTAFQQPARWIADCLAGRGRLSPQKELVEDILYDRPINDHNEDRLRRGPYTERVAEILSIPNRNEGRIFAIRGEWGQGKSSLKHLIIRNLEKMNGARCLEFNAWQWGSSEAITRKLFVEIADTLSVGEESGARQRAERFRRYAELIQRVNEPVSKSIGLLMAVIAAGVAGGLERVVSYFTGNFGSWIYFLIIITIMMICVLFFSQSWLGESEHLV